ncbi:MAG: gliding motility-associated C-terminal domain-containing protein [Chitinophagaceae bacterium]|nr:gliding motility-associated C-terminal domain-containing protein [Chitinophagaceae bacterium]
MKRFLIFSFFIFILSDCFASHISGGELIYEYLGPGSTANSKRYRITLKLFRDNNCTNCAVMPGQVVIAIYNNDNNSHIASSPFNVSKTSENNVPVSPPPVCMEDPPQLNYSIATYQVIVELTNNTNGYTGAYQTCCRITPMENVFTVAPPGQGEGTTYVCTIPGTSQFAGINSSPQFRTLLGPVCYGANFVFDFGATDPDGDSLVYTYCNAYNRGIATSSLDVTPPPPPYQSVGYINGFSGTNPLGSAAILNRQTGIISGFAPQIPGRYVVCVCIAEYRNGVLIGNHRKDFILTISNCSLASSELLTAYTNCNDLTFNFANTAPPANIQTYYWDFGDGNTSTDPAPTYTYALPGNYIVKLVVNRGLPCSDSTTSPVKAFPGFNPDFEALGQCKNTPVQFTDKTTAAFGVVDNWKWNFGEITSPTNTSTLKNPTHSYASANSYNVAFIVSTSVGCIDTIYKTIDILDQPPLSVYPKDTLICVIDTLQLNATGTGAFTWSPNYMIDNINNQNPLVSPDVTTTYRATITDAFGCQGSDTVRVRVVNNVTQFGGADTTICLTDPVVLQLTSDALHFLWTETPANNTLNNPTIKNPTATPLVTTTYHVVGNIGKCIAEDDIVVTPIPYPAANAGPDNTICFGNSAQLSASGGSIYSWSPSAFLTATNIPNPVSVKPSDNVRYIVTVRDVLGCPKPVKDTMFLFVAKIKANAGPRDTSVVLGQPLQLGASGSINYSWTPTTWLNDPNIPNPIALPLNDIQYIVRVSNNAGCFDRDSIRVHVFKIKPDLLVPNAFTPNGDGKNDVFKPIAIGMKSIDVFMVYNRWGQMLYSGSGNSAAWDGTFAGRKQETATYVWYAEGVDYLNNRLKRKGSVVLIR